MMREPDFDDAHLQFHARKQQMGASVKSLGIDKLDVADRLVLVELRRV